jgi:hypothetical protein
MSSVFPYVLVRRALLAEEALGDLSAGVDPASADEALWDGERAAALTLARRDEFRAALVATSTTFLRDLETRSFRRDKRTRHAAQTALRYLTRAAKKVSPFGRFTALEFGSLSSMAEPGPVARRRAPPSSIVDWNGAIVRAFVDHARAQAAGGHADAPLRWNPTAQRQGAEVTFLARTAGGFVVRRLDARLAEWFDTQAPPEVWLASVARALARGLPDAAEELLRSLRTKLVEAGLFEWDMRAPRARFAAITRPVSTIAAPLSALATRFGISPSAEERLELLTHGKCELLASGFEVASVPVTDVFAEDRFGGVFHELPGEVVVPWVLDAARLARASSSTSRSGADALAALGTRLLDGRCAVPFLEFYAHAARQGDPELFDDTPTPAEVYPGATCERVSGDEIVASFPERPLDDDDVASLGIWLAIGASDDALEGALSSVSVGFGRGFGRFLWAAPDSMVRAIRLRNRALARGRGVFEAPAPPECLADAHPSLGLRRLALPGVVADEDEFDADADDLSLSALFVVRGPGGRLELAATDGAPLRFVETRMTRGLESRLERLLRLLSPTRTFDARGVLDTLLTPFAQTKDGVRIDPRVRGPSGLVFARKRWTIPAAAVRPLGSATAAERWRAYVALCARLCVPDAHFVRIPGGSASRASHKPRFVATGLRSVVDDVVRTAVRAESPLVLEEALPSRGLPVEGKTYAAELYAEVSRDAEATRLEAPR